MSADEWSIPDEEAVRLANEGARRVFCPRCERGHEGPCTGPDLVFQPLKNEPLTDAQQEVIAAVRAEARAAYRGSRDEHDPEL